MESDTKVDILPDVKADSTRIDSLRKDDSVTIEVSSGGVALGSYQGGYLLGRMIRYSASDSGKPRILTGASAGAINTLGGLFHAFHPLRNGQTYSPYAEWLKIDWENLTDGAPSDTPLSLLDTNAIQGALRRVVQNLLEPPDPSAKNVQVQVGFAITRFLPEVVYKDLNVRSAAEKIVVRMRWRDTCPDTAFSEGCYQAWTTGYGDTTVSDRRRMNQLWFGPYGTDTSLIRQNLVFLARASSSFPVAFPPARIPIFTYTCRNAVGQVTGFIGNSTANKAWAKCFENIKRDAPPCVLAGPHTGSMDTIEVSTTGRSAYLFIRKIDSAHGRWDEDSKSIKFSDGGQFENQPLELAMAIFDHPSSVGAKPFVRAIRMLSPTHYPLEEKSPRIARSMSAEWFLMLGRSPDPTSQEVLRALERKHVNPKFIELNTTSLPLASEHAIHFSGFFQERFRRFDFLVGFLDAFDTTRDIRTPAYDSKALRKGVDAIIALPDGIWMRDALSAGSPTDLAQSLFFKARTLSLELQRKANVREPSDDDMVRLEMLQREVARTIEKLYGNGNALTLPLLPTIELLEVLYGSLQRLHGTFVTLRKRDEESAAKRYVNFMEGLERSSPCSRMTVKGITKLCSEQLKKPSSDVNDVYLQVARFMDKDAFGLGNSFVYPAGLYHARPLVGIVVGQKPRWSPPYLRFESSNSGFFVLQGFSIVPRSFHRLHVAPLDLLRGEIGLHSTWTSSSFQQWLPLRAGIEIPIGSTFSLFPSWTYSVALADTLRNPRLGLDLAALDLVHLRIEPKPGHLLHELPDIFAGIRLGFDPFAIAEGFMNGTNKDRRLDRRKE